MGPEVARAAALWRGEADTAVTATRNYSRLQPILAAMSETGLAVEPVLYSEVAADGLAAHLCRFDAVLVWADPVSGDGDRVALDELLRYVASKGPWVSAHPDTIMKMGTKEVLYRTRELGWGAVDTRLYMTIEEFRSDFAASLSANGPRVLKQNRGNGGIGVWKVAPFEDSGLVRVQHAAPRDDVTEDMSLDEFMNRCTVYFANDGRLIDQPFATRISEGMIRAYLVEREVVGFARQLPANRTVEPAAPAPDRVLGMPSAKTMYPADEPEFRELRVRLEREWVPGLCGLVAVDDAELPVLWDADFLYGPPGEDGDDTHMLCEINVSSVIPYPDAVPVKLAQAVKRRCDHSSTSGRRKFGS